MEVLVSIDPSSTSTGWAVFEYNDKGCKLVDSGQIDLRKGNHTLDDRIDCLYNFIASLCREWSPKVAVFETPDIFTNKKFGSAHTQIAYRKAVDCTKAALWQSLGMENCCGVRVQEWKNSKSKICTIHEMNDAHGLKLTEKENDRADAIGIGDEYLQRLDTKRAFSHDRRSQ